VGLVAETVVIRSTARFVEANGSLLRRRTIRFPDNIPKGLLP
jgi:hypothetical protein